ncbi:MAG: sugar ABC transporter permease [Halanaerobiaceae bacterium]|nr:sugar ABC transporter permease [Halanaerobiaceae bacterium]
MNSQRVRNYLSLAFSYLFLLLIIFIVFVPVLWIFSASLNPGSNLYSSSVSLLPRNYTFDHYKELFTETRFASWYVNSIKVGTGSSLLSIFLVTLTSYAFSRLRFTGRKYGLMVMLILQMFPATMNMVAIYLLLNLAGLLDSHLGLILIYAGGSIPYNTWLMKGYLDTIPRSMEEAAIIDGASQWTILWKIILPLCVPIISVLAIFSFVGPFTDFLMARIVLTTPSKYTLAVGLRDFIADQFSKNFTMFAAGAILAALPITVLYLALQGMLISGLTKGSAKQ